MNLTRNGDTVKYRVCFQCCRFWQGNTLSHTLSASCRQKAAHTAHVEGTIGFRCGFMFLFSTRISLSTHQVCKNRFTLTCQLSCVCQVPENRAKPVVPTYSLFRSHSTLIETHADYIMTMRRILLRRTARLPPFRPRFEPSQPDISTLKKVFSPVVFRRP